MNAFILMVPLLLIRYGLPLFFDKSALVRASHYPEFPKERKIFLIVYELCTCLLLIIPFFLKINHDSIGGIIIYVLGIVILIISTICFSKPNRHNLNSNGIYKLSRNPMYVGYFIYFLGCAFITKSILIFVVLMLFQISCHWLILEEEKWCIKNLGTEYVGYMKKVRRYL